MPAPKKAGFLGAHSSKNNKCPFKPGAFYNPVHYYLALIIGRLNIHLAASELFDLKIAVF